MEGKQQISKHLKKITEFIFFSFINLHSLIHESWNFCYHSIHVHSAPPGSKTINNLTCVKNTVDQNPPPIFVNLK